MTSLDKIAKIDKRQREKPKEVEICVERVLDEFDKARRFWGDNNLGFLPKK